MLGSIVGSGRSRVRATRPHNPGLHVCELTLKEEHNKSDNTMTCYRPYRGYRAPILCLSSLLYLVVCNPLTPDISPRFRYNTRGLLSLLESFRLFQPSKHEVTRVVCRVPDLRRGQCALGAGVRASLSCIWILATSPTQHIIHEDNHNKAASAKKTES